MWVRVISLLLNIVILKHRPKGNRRLLTSTYDCSPAPPLLQASLQSRIVKAGLGKFAGASIMNRGDPKPQQV